VCLLAAPWVPLSVSADNGWPHNALRHHWLMPISCHFRDCKALLVTSLTHVSGAIASVQAFTFTFYLRLMNLNDEVDSWRTTLRRRNVCHTDLESKRQQKNVETGSYKNVPLLLSPRRKARLYAMTLSLSLLMLLCFCLFRVFCSICYCHY